MENNIFTPEPPQTMNPSIPPTSKKKNEVEKEPGGPNKAKSSRKAAKRSR